MGFSSIFFFEDYNADVDIDISDFNFTCVSKRC